MAGGQDLRRGAWSGCLGVLAVGLLVVALVLPGRPFRTSDTAPAMHAALLDHRRAFLVSTWLAGLGLVGFLVFLLALRARLDRREGASTANLAVLGGLASWLLTLVGMAVFAGLALGGGQMPVAALTAMVGVGNAMIEVGKLPLALLLAAVAHGAAGGRLLPRRTAGLLYLAAAIGTISSLPPFLADRGAWQFGGPLDLLGAVPATVALLWLTVQVARTPSEAT